MNQSKPSWGNAPEWARFLAMDADGEWFWYGSAPVLSGDAWYPRSGQVATARWTSIPGDAVREERPA